MKIAVLIDTWFPAVGGGQINAWEISSRLAQNGQIIEIITRNCGVDNYKGSKYLTIRKLGRLSKPTDDIARLKYLFESLIYLIKNDFDVVLAHAFLPGLVAKIFMIIKGKPAIFIVHGTSIDTNLLKGFKAWLEKFISTQIKYSAQITVSRDFLKVKNVNDKIEYIPNGINPIFFKQPVELKKRVKKQLLFVGRLHPQKNLINLIEAIKILKTESFPVELLIVGDGPQKRQIKELIKKYNLEDFVKLEGPKTPSQLINYYLASTAFILPSIYEGQALTLLEAWACKLPVIVSKTGDNTYLVKEGKNGYFIQNQDDPISISKAIKKALNNNELGKIGQNGFLDVKNYFSWDYSAQQIIKLLKNL